MIRCSVETIIEQEQTLPNHPVHAWLALENPIPEMGGVGETSALKIADPSNRLPRKLLVLTKHTDMSRIKAYNTQCVYL